MVRGLTIIAATALIIASLAAHAQSTPSQLTYRCVGKDGKKYYGSTVPMPCLGQLIEQLNTSGMVVKRIDPDGDEKERAVKDAELRIDAIKKRQASYDKELEFYKGDNKPPARLQDDIRDAEIDLQAQENLLAAKKKDVDTINAKYDQDKQRYLELTGRR